MRNLIPTFCIFIGATLIWTGCGNSSESPESNLIYSEALAKEISFVTNGDVHFDQTIEVIFNNDIISDEEVGSSPSDVFDFSPSLKGKALWKSKSVLQFVPDEELPMREQFNGVLQLQKLSADFKEKGLEDLKFFLNVLGRDIASFNAELKLKDRNDPKILVYQGTLTFTEATKVEDVKAAVSLTGNKSLNLNWNVLDNKSFQFISEEINRTERIQDFSFKVASKQLMLEEVFEENFELPPLTEMRMVSLKAEEEGKSPRVRIQYSDELDMDQQITGLISVTPKTTFEAKKLGNTVILDGNFKFGQKYQIKMEAGIRSRWGTKTTKVITQEISFSDIQPQLEFASDGVILPSSNQKKVQFYTTNLKRVHLEVKKIYTNKLGRILQSEKLSSSKNRNRGFNDSYTNAVGVVVKSQSIDLNNQANEWMLNELDLSDLFSNYGDGIFLISMRFTPEDVSVPITSDKLTYLEEKGQIYKPILLSDIGMTLKSGNNDHVFFITDLITAQPLSGARVSLLNYDGEEITSAVSNAQGIATFTRSRYFYNATAKKGTQITALKKDDMQWSTSGFDVGGLREYGNNTRGFIYTERGVYRPGDSVHVGFIARNKDKTFPQNHPVSITVRDPEYNTVFEQTKVKSQDGFYVFAFATDSKAPTGNYNININAGGSYFYQELKIETVVADKLNVNVKPEKRTLSWTDKSLDYLLDVKYLFGAPASNLQATVDVEVLPALKTFANYGNYTFTRADIDFKSFTKNILKGTLDEKGQLKGNWIIPNLGDVPSMLKVKVNAKITEKGGQPNEGWNVVDLEPYPNYVGVSDPSGYGYFATGQEVRFPIVLLNTKGEKQIGKSISYKIYRNDKNWWYQYDNRRNYQLKYKQDNQTYLEIEGKVTTKENNTFISFNPSENGEYLIEVIDSNGHIASLFFSAYRYGSVPGGDLNEGTLALKSDKESYQPGDRAKIRLPNPQQGTILMTVEKGNELLSHQWVKPSGTSEELTLELPITQDMMPNVYVTLSVIQPHDQTTNDRPIRTFGILPISVIDPATKIGFDIGVKPSLLPNEAFEIKVNTLNQKQAQFSIAVVDEGLLSLTQFQTPNPWNDFFRKIGLFVDSYDVYSHVISANKGDVFQTFSIGGAEALSYRESQTDPIDGKDRFQPVSMFKGPLMTDERGRATVKFKMPNYNGAVRIMVVGAQGNSYGQADKTVPVKSDLILQPTLPRQLSPGDEITLPVSLFKLNSAIKNATLNIKLDGPLTLIGSESQSVTFGDKEEAYTSFKIRVNQSVGQAKVTLTGNTGSFKVTSETNISVIPSASRVYDKQTEQLIKGKTLTMAVPKIGIEGTNMATLDLNIFPNMDFDHRLKWLISYPYGCIEQTVSAVFPQLYLKKMGYFDASESTEIDRNITEAINKLQQFTTSSSGFSYWPGERESSEWGTNYATHFLIEAKKAGYAVPDFLYQRAINSLSNDARNHVGKLSSRVNRAFILSLDDKSPVGEMNLLMENELSKMTDAQKWMLAAAYHQAGVDQVKNQILQSSGTSTQAYDPFDYTFGSKYRDDAIILYCATLMGETETAELMAKSVATQLSGKEYLSTQSSGYMLLALGKYFEKIGLNLSQGKVIKGTVVLANGKRIPFNTNNRLSLPIRNNFGENISIELSTDSNVDQIYASLSWNGVPLTDQRKTTSNNLSLEVKWYDENGNLINPDRLKQGESFFGRFTVGNTSPVSEVSELALVQIFPAGWQIENLRLNNELLPDWTNNWTLNKESYLDLRDDRAMWFFDLKGKEKLDFVIKLNCVTPGSYQLPGTLVEAMYNNDFKATQAGKKVSVEAFK